MLEDQEAEDIVQEVFAKVSRGFESFKGPSKLSTWLREYQSKNGRFEKPMMSVHNLIS